MSESSVAVVGLAALVFGLVLAYLAFLRKAGPNEVIVVSGRGPVKFITGGADMVVPLFHTWNRLSLEVMTLDVTTPEVYTSQGVPVIVDGVAQIKIRKDEASLHAAAERFLGKAPEEIAKIALETVQGHLRAILGTMSVEDIYKNRDQFAQKVQEVSAGDLANMGLGIDSFTIRDIRDKHGYLEALGKPRIAEVKRTAAIAEAVARQGGLDRPGGRRARDARAAGRGAEAGPGGGGQARRRGGRGQRLQAAPPEGSRRARPPRGRDRQLPGPAGDRRAAGHRQPKRAEAEMAYELQKKTMEIQVQEQEIKRKEKELDATIRRQADAKRYELETLAAAAPQPHRDRGRAEKSRLATWPTARRRAAWPRPRWPRPRARPRRRRTRRAGWPRREIRQAQGLAEALAMEKKAEAWRKYSEAAVLQILAPILPEIARAIAEPLSRIDRITMVNTGGNGDDRRVEGDQRGRARDRAGAAGDRVADRPEARRAAQGRAAEAERRRQRSAAMPAQRRREPLHAGRARPNDGARSQGPLPTRRGVALPRGGARLRPWHRSPCRAGGPGRPASRDQNELVSRRSTALTCRFCRRPIVRAANRHLQKLDFARGGVRRLNDLWRRALSARARPAHRGAGRVRLRDRSRQPMEVHRDIALRLIARLEALAKAPGTFWTAAPRARPAGAGPPPAALDAAVPARPRRPRH